MTGAVTGQAVPTSVPTTARRGPGSAVMDTSHPAWVGLQLLCSGVMLSWCPGLGGEWECPSLPVVKAARALSRWGKGFGVVPWVVGASPSAHKHQHSLEVTVLGGEGNHSKLGGGVN